MRFTYGARKRIWGDGLEWGGEMVRARERESAREGEGWREGTREDERKERKGARILS